MPDRDWMLRADCRSFDPEVFFPNARDLASQKFAESICADCPVRSACDQYAKATRPSHGIWAGRFRNEKNFITTTVRASAHGTNAGFEAHRRRGELPCGPCHRAHQLYNAEQYQLRKARR